MKAANKKTEKWRQIILEFKSKAAYNNPFLDVDISAVFTAPSGCQIRREAYWDGDNVYKISFAPTETGVWKYKLTADEPSGLNGLEDEIECVDYQGDLEIYRHGFLKVHPSGRYLIHDDGTPFFWLGDTHWEFAYKERWDWSNHPDMKSMFKGMAERRVSQGFNVYQTNLRSDRLMGGSQYYWTEGKDGSLPNIEFYQQELDRRMYYLADLGLVNALGFAWSMSILNNIEQQKILARYIVARYGALPVVWTLAGEVAGYNGGEERKLCIDGWREVAEYVEKLDGYGTLQTAHYTNERPFADYYQEEAWFDFTLNQAGHGDFTVGRKDYQDFLEKYSKKPFIEGECFYEFCSTLEENGTRLCTADMLRRAAYMSIQLGGCGYTYGAQGIWDNVLEKEQASPFGNIFNRFDITWYEAIDGIGAEQMGHMKAFYEKVRFEEFLPYADDGNNQNANIFVKLSPLVTVSENHDRVLVYYEDFTAGAKINGLQKGLYQAMWFNPRTGEYSAYLEDMIAIDGEWELPVKKEKGDWLLVAERR
ncbi:protein of unknown function [Anaerocolumna jejuensis DSM 15929]|uniref:Collagen-binding domain of a collagenase n=1 Tax=Anaerocolumna jejuensis DSM 15929 TaxID=1121322 RepID=A0A1M6TVI3_9FIRM|nr:DUF4038 domain-containing protein [Anaerocolumna jejuensis]SHK60957.1 protein of unknown function [Anaerocolumna jejuensis DSM 15929]